MEGRREGEGTYLDGARVGDEASVLDARTRLAAEGAQVGVRHHRRASQRHGEPRKRAAASAQPRELRARDVREHPLLEGGGVDGDAAIPRARGDVLLADDPVPPRERPQQLERSPHGTAARDGDGLSADERGADAVVDVGEAALRCLVVDAGEGERHIGGEISAERLVGGAVLKRQCEKEFYDKTPSHNTGHGTGAHWH